MRFNFRFSIFLVPLFFYSDYCFASYTQRSLYLMDKYVERVHQYIEKLDPTIMNPYLSEEDEDD